MRDTATKKATPIRRRERFTDRLMVRLGDAAASLGVSEAFVRGEIRNGRMEARKAGRATLIPADELRRWAADLPPAA
ncbi:MAG: helix-turn-helix domain-containing protein [Thermoanaerobaculia bacterium]|nr:helix-turn-helix domain-containing protein [Thermoanaerobaculia bacterium]